MRKLLATFGLVLALCAAAYAQPEILAQNKLEKVIGASSTGIDYAVGDDVRMTIWTYDAADPTRQKRPLPPFDSGRIWSGTANAFGGFVSEVSSEADTRVIRFTLLTAKDRLIINGTVNNATKTRSIKVVPGIISETPTIVLQSENLPNAVLPGILIGGKPTTANLIVSWGLSSSIDGVAQYFITPNPIGGTNRNSLVYVSPVQVPGLAYDTRLGGRWLLQLSPGAWTGNIYAEVWKMNSDGTGSLLGVPRKDITGPLQ